ncbi:MAG: FAD-dependent oxidoreductase [Phycisphaerales bacterium]|nr:MAG: FAD-dependent oxidoreductase [Phycisphaerales bacterium]
MGLSSTARREFLRRLGLAATAAWTFQNCPRRRASAESEGAGPRSSAPVIREAPRQTPVVHDCDICIIGGSCTGVFAAVRAARLGASVALVEGNGFFGGVATAAKVNIWHSRYDTAGQREIIGGLAVELIERLVRRSSARIHEKSNPSRYAVFNSAEMIMELDRMIGEQKRIRPFLHALFVDGIVEQGRMTHAIIEDKSGRRAIGARYFIDATGDADVLARIGLPVRKDDALQPPTMCAFLAGLDAVRQANPDFRLAQAIYDKQRFANALDPGFVWAAEAVGLPGVTMVAGTRVFSADCSDADQLTRASMEGRRQVRAIRDILHDNFNGGDAVAVGALPTRIGVRETRHLVSRHCLKEREVLEGVRFDDAIANGSYRVDVHHAGRGGLTFRYLDGREVTVVPGKKHVERRWRPERPESPTFYQIPYRSLVPQNSVNVLCAGRMLDADRGAFGAARVMVNCNQMGEAAGTACCLALQGGSAVGDVDTRQLRRTLAGGGSIIV